MGWNNCLKCGEVDDSCKCSEELEADNADELIEAMKEGFATRLADVEAKAERYRLALIGCRAMLKDESKWYSCRSEIAGIIAEVLK